MLLHLPIVMLATLSPVAVSDTVPSFDMVRECRLEGDSSVDFGRCRRDEATALAQLRTEWPQFVVADRSTCLTAATVGGFSSYVELLSCLEMARDANGGVHPTTPQTTDAMRRRVPGVTVGIGHDPITSGQKADGGGR